MSTFYSKKPATVKDNIMPETTIIPTVYLILINLCSFFLM